MYRVETDETSQDQLDALPPAGQRAWHELRATLELVPWNGRPANPKVPDGIRTWAFGENAEGIVYYLILEDQQRVEILAVRWFD